MRMIVDQPWKAYFLGLLYSDGNIGKREVSLTFTESDGEILKEICILLNINYNESVKLYPSRLVKFNNGTYLCKPYYKLRIYSVELIKDLALLGMGPAKSLTIDFPCNLPFIRDFIRGYFDGDGCITFNYYKNKNRYYPKVRIAGSINFINGLYNHLGYGSIEFSKKINVLIISNSIYCKLFYNYIYTNCLLCFNRKKEKFIKLINGTYM
jgi:hypothetical protein